MPILKDLLLDSIVIKAKLISYLSQIILVFQKTKMQTKHSLRSPNHIISDKTFNSKCIINPNSKDKYSSLVVYITQSTGPYNFIQQEKVSILMRFYHNPRSC